MQYYFAPMEGITDSFFRRIHHAHFPGLDRYYTPFFSPTLHRCLTHREERELPVTDSVSCKVIPQILTKDTRDFIWMTEQCADRGYAEVNLNLGCPSGTVTAKGKGSGMLRDPDALDRFFEEIFTGTKLPISVKTRIGFTEPEEFKQLLEIFNRYPIRELTVHPRVRSAFYQGSVDMDTFRFCTENTVLPLCYNGDLCKKEQIEAIGEDYPKVQAVMLGRGLIGDPGMLTPGGTQISALEAFLNELLETYLMAFGGSRNAMFRLKEHWSYLLPRFRNAEKLGKALRKTTDLNEYRTITTRIFRECPYDSN